MECIQPTANSEGSTYYVPGEDISHEQETASLAFSHVEDCEPVFLPVSRERYISKENCKGVADSAGGSKFTGRHKTIDCVV